MKERKEANKTPRPSQAQGKRCVIIADDIQLLSSILAQPRPQLSQIAHDLTQPVISFKFGLSRLSSFSLLCEVMLRGSCLSLIPNLRSTSAT